MSEKSSDPPKAGSKLAQTQALGRRGGIRFPAATETEKDEIHALHPKDARVKARKLGREDAAHAKPASAPTSQSETTTIRPRKAEATIRAKVESAKAVLAKVEEDVMVKPGPTAVVGEPWKDLDPPISKSAYYRRLKIKAAKSKSKAKTPAKRTTQNTGKSAP